MVLGAILCIAAISIQAHAQPKANTWYGKADLGGSWMEDTEVKAIFGDEIGDDGDMEFDPGVRFGLGAGYNVTEWFAAEFELGMNWNEVDKMGGARSLDAYWVNVPFLLNAKLQWPNATRLRPYIGAGIGGASSVLDIDHLTYETTEADVFISGSASDVTFAWQGFAGVTFDINEYMSLGVEYRYQWTESPDLDMDWGSYYYWGPWRDDRLEVDDIQSHSISLVFTYQF